MENHELDEIDASARAIVRRAYDLGRSEALKRVVDVLSADRPSPDQLVLAAPDETTPAPDASSMNGASSSEKPWWAWPVR